MPIVTLTEDNQPRYYAVSEACETNTRALVEEYKLYESSNREYVEHELRREYQRRLTTHAYEVAQLAHIVTNPPEDESLLGGLKLLDQLAMKVARDAIWLRTYEPFVALFAEAVDRAQGCTVLQLGDEQVSSLDDDSWEQSEHVLWKQSPYLRDRLAESQERDRLAEEARKLPPAAEKLMQQAHADWAAAWDKAKAIKAKVEARASKPTKAKRSTKRRAA